MKRIIILFALFSDSFLNAQIHYHDISPDTTINTWNCYSFSPLGTPYLLIWWHPGNEVVLQSNGIEILFDAAGNFPAKLSSGDTIGSTGIWQSTNYDAMNSGTNGNWLTNSSNKYLGYRFLNASGWTYGWLKMTVTFNANAFSVKEWAYNQVKDELITAGQTAAVTPTVNTTSIQKYSARHQINCYPNPAKEHVNIVLDSSEKQPYTCIIVNSQGQQLVHTQIINERKINVENFLRGQYYICLYKNGRVVDLYPFIVDRD